VSIGMTRTDAKLHFEQGRLEDVLRIVNRPSSKTEMSTSTSLSGKQLYEHEHDGHVVQFYIDDEALLDSLSSFIGEALGAGGLLSFWQPRRTETDSHNGWRRAVSIPPLSSNRDGMFHWMLRSFCQRWHRTARLISLDSQR